MSSGPPGPIFTHLAFVATVYIVKAASVTSESDPVASITSTELDHDN